jgi:hypothetical protein
MKNSFVGEFNISDELHRSELSLPISMGHSSEEILKISEVINKFK